VLLGAFVRRRLVHCTSVRVLQQSRGCECMSMSSSREESCSSVAGAIEHFQMGLRCWDELLRISSAACVVRAKAVTVCSRLLQLRAGHVTVVLLAQLWWCCIIWAGGCACCWCCTVAGAVVAVMFALRCLLFGVCDALAGSLFRPWRAVCYEWSVEWQRGAVRGMRALPAEVLHTCGCAHTERLLLPLL
jgi:hypothetical protein